MKNLFLVIFAQSIFVQGAFASSGFGIPNNAKLIKTNTESTRWHEQMHQANAVVDEIKSKNLNSVQSSDEIEIECQTVYITFKKNKDYDQSNGKHERTIQTDVYCLERDFSEMAILSLLRTCIQNPQLEKCFHPEIQQGFKQIKKTEFIVK